MQRSISPRSKVITVHPLKLESSSMPQVKGHAGCRICDLFCASLSLASWHLPGREILAHSLEEWLMTLCCAVSCIASQALLCSALDSGQRRIGCCTFGRLWSRPEVQGGSRGPDAPLVVLLGKRAAQVTVELVGPCSCQFSGLTASHTCACRNPAGRAFSGRVQVSLEQLVVLCC